VTFGQHLVTFFPATAFVESIARFLSDEWASCGCTTNWERCCCHSYR